MDVPVTHFICEFTFVALLFIRNIMSVFQNVHKEQKHNPELLCFHELTTHQQHH